MEKEKTERAGIRVIFSVAFFIFSWYATKKGGIWNVSGGILFSFGKVDSCK